jgi:predicted DNA-binding protein
MEQERFIERISSKLAGLLNTQFGASAGDLTEKAQTVAVALPQELGQQLQKLAENLARLGSESEREAASPDQLADLAYAAGQICQQLVDHQQVRMELENVKVGPDYVSARALQRSEIEPLAKLLVTRDRIFRKVADFTLKALLMAVGLLILGLILGVV